MRAGARTATQASADHCDCQPLVALGARRCHLGMTPGLPSRPSRDRPGSQTLTRLTYERAHA